MLCETHQYDCGVVCLYTSDLGSELIGDHLSALTGDGGFSFALAYFSKSRCSAEDVIDLMRQAHNVPFAACSTAGEITPRGLDDGQLVVLLFPAEYFSVAANSFVGSHGGIENIVSDVHAMKTSFVENNGGEGTIFALCLMDGASFMEEAITAAFHWGLDDIPLLGGSAGDNMNFEETCLVLNGRLVEERAILLLISSSLPVEVFKTENFVPSDEKLVVTRSDPDRRIVHELNAAPAALAYAEVIGTDPYALTPQSFASHPLVMRVGGEYYCRSIQKVNDDYSLSFFCAVDDGIVLTVAEQTGMARTTRKALSAVGDKLGEVDFVLGFDCVLRQIDARNRQVTHKISEIYRDYRVVGFNTYGEQYRSMHLNQTLTGVAFGKPVAKQDPFHES